MPERPLVLDGSPLDIDDVAAVARRQRRVTVSAKALAAMDRARRVVDDSLDDGRAHYGINTGFGSLAKQRIGRDDLRALQRNLVRSHAAGAGEPLPTDVVRAMMLLLAASLARGLSGVRPRVASLLAGMLNAGVTPVVPSLGSVGASGDLAPLAHVARVMIGEGEAVLTSPRGSRRMNADAAMAAAGLRPVMLEAKEGLALINGTHLMAGWGALIALDAAGLAEAADLALAFSIDACRASHGFLDPRLYAARRHEHAAAAAARVASYLRGSTIRTSHLKNDPRVQDPYSLRAGPTVHGAAGRAIADAADAIAGELGAVTDNPLIVPRGVLGSRRDAVLSGANFHGMPVAIPLDALAVALAHLAGVSERRTYLITGAFEPESHLKPFLAPRPGLQSGYMIAQYTAAACVNELVGLAAPASVANVPTCAGMEDYNSFGPRGAAKAARAVELVRTVLAIEILCAAQAIETHRPLRSGRAVERAHAAVRRRVPALTADRSPAPDIQAVAGLLRSGELVSAASAR